MSPPELVRSYLEQALSGAPVPRQVQIAQVGSMRQKPGGRELRFTATERFDVERVGFAWRARFPLLGPLGLEVTDAFADGDGALEVRIGGVRVQHQRGSETARGEALRYLAELPWAPFAMRANPEPEWHELDGRSVEVATEVLGEHVAVRLDFDERGDIARAASDDRRVRLGKEWVPRPWAGEYRGYERLGDVRLPTGAEVYWDFESGRFVYWRGRVTSVRLLAEPFGAG